jgi:hypothetical protein
MNFPKPPSQMLSATTQVPNEEKRSAMRLSGQNRRPYVSGTSHSYTQQNGEQEEPNRHD